MQLRPHLRNNKGFTLIELLISLSLLSIIVLTTFNLFYFSIVSSNDSDSKDSILSNGRYGLEYMIGEIERADKIIDSKKVKGFDSSYKNNLKFVIYNYMREDNKADKHEFTAFYIRDNSLYRVKTRKSSGDYTNISVFDGVGSGNNYICENIKDITGTSVDFEDRLINLSLIVGNESFSYDFETLLSINCPVDY